MIHFSDWCSVHGQAVVPASDTTVADYISSMADDGYAPSTIGRRLAAISQAHQAAGYGENNPVKSPGVRETHKGIRRSIQHRPRKATPIRSSDLRAYFGTLQGNLRNIQARTILTWGLAGAFRRSELVGLNVEDLEATDEGYRVTVWGSKTDQEGRGQVKAIVYGKHPETCPVLAMRAWLDATGVSKGPIFRTVWPGGQVDNRRLHPVTVSRIVKRAAETLGKDPSEFSGHSLRRGFVTEAAKAGAGLHAIAQQTGHKSMKVLESYIADETIFEGNAVHDLGL
jgi:integrase